MFQFALSSMLPSRTYDIAEVHSYVSKLMRGTTAYAQTAADLRYNRGYECVVSPWSKEFPRGYNQLCLLLFILFDCLIVCSIFLFLIFTLYKYLF